MENAANSQNLVLKQDCAAQAIPSGESVMLPAGTQATITQALGGSLTLRTTEGLFRVEAGEAQALGVRPEAFSSDESIPESAEFSIDNLWNALKTVYDPEIPVNIVDLGLIYDLQPQPIGEEEYEVHVSMTLTAPGCGMGPTIARDAQKKLEQVKGVAKAQVDIVWDPQWTPHMISPEARSILGLE